MMYVYKGIDPQGKKVKEKVEASSLEQAKAKIRAKNILYKSVHEEKPSLFDAMEFSKSSRISAKELSSLSREIAMYIRSGISIVSALKIIQSHYAHKKKIQLFLVSVSSYLDEGKSFFTALQAQNVLSLPEFYKQSIKVSENGGVLDEVLLELARFLKEQDTINKEIRSALFYPIFMLVISLLMIAGMLSFVVPQIIGVFDSMEQELPASTLFVVGLGDFFAEYFTSILASIAIGSCAFVFTLKKSYTLRLQVHRLMLRLPLFGKIIEKNELARFAYMASLLTRSGLPFVHTINLSAKILKNLVIQELFMKASQSVVEGTLLSQALHDAPRTIDYAFIQSLALGEETSEIENVLRNISSLYFEENKDTTATLLTFLEPILMLFVGGSIGFIVIAMLLPIFSISIG